eukprot:TRINITY_DN9458_c0_g1_i3.p1 TRINITY_DN9458_c0_g1~~TRINITY_DN9458_c0_g1_i3.p1  ORF type:complete len:107 (+),score=34.05 TRINITY_DN9458_c0_g1_i3:106-426(+)
MCWSLYFFFFFFNDTATTEIYTLHIVGSVRCVQETGYEYDQGCEQLFPTDFQGPTSCLLYTSDAADDMQCVDLGGRRIIKKKKKKVQRPTHITKLFSISKKNYTKK